MTDTTKYIEDHLKPKIAWYDAKAIKAKRNFIYLGLMQVTLLAFVPVINAFARYQYDLIYVSSILAALGSICGTIVIFSNLRENWSRFRLTHGKLESLIILKENSVAPFNKTNADKLFIETCENIMQEENNTWLDQVSSN